MNWHLNQRMMNNKFYNHNPGEANTSPNLIEQETAVIIAEHMGKQLSLPFLINRIRVSKRTPFGTRIRTEYRKDVFI